MAKLGVTVKANYRPAGICVPSIAAALFSFLIDNADKPLIYADAAGPGVWLLSKIFVTFQKHLASAMLLMPSNKVALSELPIAPGVAAQVKGYYWTQLMKRSDSEGEDASEHHLEALGDDRGLLALATREVAVNRIQQPGQELHRI